MAEKRKKRVKSRHCRVYGSWMNTSNPTRRSQGATKLGSKTCKTKKQIKKSTSKIVQISKMASKIRKPGEDWQSAIRRASSRLK